jgi:hypothetical protein
MTVAAADAPLVTLEYDSFITNRDQFLRIKADVSLPPDSEGQLFWTADNGLDLSAAALTPLRVDFAPFASNRTLALYLVVGPHSMPVGSRFTLTLTCATFAPLTLTAASAVTVRVNAPPTSGSFLVAPTAGTAGVDVFTLSSRFWTDEDIPLTYQYGYVSAIGLVALIAKTEFTFGRADLPAGGVGSNYTLVAYSKVFDTFSAAVTSGLEVQVLPNLGANATARVQAALDALAADPNAGVDEKKQGVALSCDALNAADCSRSPDCAALFRLDCAGTANTCGVCLDGYYTALIGDGNSTCLSVTSGDPATGATPAGDKKCGGECFGRGLCTFAYADSGLPLRAGESCGAGDPSCAAVCECDEGFALSSDCR